MAREYIKVRKTKADYEWYDIPNTDSLAKTVYEETETFDTGVLDEAGNKIMAREKKNPIGFVHFRAVDR